MLFRFVLIAVIVALVVSFLYRHRHALRNSPAARLLANGALLYAVRTALYRYGPLVLRELLRSLRFFR